MGGGGGGTGPEMDRFRARLRPGRVLADEGKMPEIVIGKIVEVETNPGNKAHQIYCIARLEASLPPRPLTGQNEWVYLVRC